MFYRFLVSIYWNELLLENSLEYLGSCTITGRILDSQVVNNVDAVRKSRISTIELDTLSKSYQLRQFRQSKLSTNVAISSTEVSMTHPSQNNKWRQEAAIKDSLEKSIQHLQSQGYLSLCISILVNIPWILLLLFVRETIEYNQETDTPSH